MSDNTTPRPAYGLAALAAMFAATQAEQRPAFMPFFPVGYPTYDDSLAAIEVMAAAGVDGFEIGIPFSDPLADGAVIQAAAQIALENGVTVRTALDAVRELRERGITQPMLIFSYLNPLMAFGIEAFVLAAKAAGADGFIIPDLPPDEAELFAAICKREAMALVFFVAPTSSPERIQLVSQQATGFIYMVSVTGITGARTELPLDIVAFIERVRAQTKQPLVLGFGISTPEHVQRLQGLVDGFIVGSALVRAAQSGVDTVRTLTADLRQA